MPEIQGFKTFSTKVEAFHSLNLLQHTTKDLNLLSHLEEGYIEITLTPSPFHDHHLKEVERALFKELKRWHAPFCVIWNCDGLECLVSEEALHSLIKKLKGFYCLDVLFYTHTKQAFPMPLTMGRHAALLRVQSLLEQYAQRTGRPKSRFGC